MIYLHIAKILCESRRQYLPRRRRKQCLSVTVSRQHVSNTLTVPSRWRFPCVPDSTLVSSLDHTISRRHCCYSSTYTFNKLYCKLHHCTTHSRHTHTLTVSHTAAPRMVFTANGKYALTFTFTTSTIISKNNAASGMHNH